MRRLCVSVLMASALAACSDPAPIPETDLRLRIDIPSETVELGRAFPLTVSLVFAKVLEPEPFDPALLAPLRLEAESVSRREDDKRVEEVRRFRAYAFAPKDVLIRAPRISARRSADGSTQVARADGLRLRVVPLLDPEQPGPAERAEALPRSRTWLPTALAALVLGLVLVGGVRRWRRRPAPSSPRPSPPPAPAVHHQALADLSALAGEDPAGAFRRVSEVLRDYVSGRFAVRAREMTTEELLGALGERGAALAAVLPRCDRVKFAAFTPPALELDRLLADARDFVERSASR